MFENVYSLSTPVILTCLFSEIVYCFISSKNHFSLKDSFANMATTIINQCMNLVVFFVSFHVYSAVGSLVPWKLENTTLNFIFAIIGVDFLFYWFHRMGHTLNILWASHMPHHSSEELNYTVALRSSITQRMTGILFYWPLALFGFSPELIIAAIALNLVMQFWQHTRSIRRLPRWFEAIFNSPTHHRIHHATNPKYLDKNFAGILIIWDKIFGTHVEETEEPVYGVLRKNYSYCPNNIFFQYWKVLWRHTMTLKGGKSRLKYLFCPLDQLNSRYPDFAPKNEILYNKDELNSLGVIFLTINIVGALYLMSLIIAKNGPFDAYEKLIGGSFLWGLGIYWGKILDGKVGFFLKKESKNSQHQKIISRP